MPNKEFLLQDLEKILADISLHLDKKIKLYIFGGAVMIYHKIKTVTKDIDILIDTIEEYNLFQKAANQAEFVRTFASVEYKKFHLSAMLTNHKTGGRIDLFH